MTHSALWQAADLTPPRSRRRSLGLRAAKRRTPFAEGSSDGLTPRIHAFGHCRRQRADGAARSCFRLRAQLGGRSGQRAASHASGHRAGHPAPPATRSCFRPFKRTPPSPRVGCSLGTRSRSADRDSCSATRAALCECPRDGPRVQVRQSVLRVRGGAARRTTVAYEQSPTGAVSHARERQAPQPCPSASWAPRRRAAARAVRVAGVARTIEVRSNDGAWARVSRALPSRGR
jgi:hypothetical protein